MLAEVEAATPGGAVHPRPRPVAGSVDELLADVERREPYRSADLRSSAQFERVWIHGDRHVVKYVHVDDDVAMRTAGDIGCLPLRVWASGLMDAAPDVIDHAVVGVAGGYGRNGWGAAVLMRDVSHHLVPPGDEPISEERHLRFLDHLATFSARLWGWHDEVGLLPHANRWRFWDASTIEAERALGWPEPVPRLAADGWQRFARRAPDQVAVAVDALRHDPTPLTSALAATPSTFLHGDWKLGNLGTAPDGRTILLDWAYPGQGPVCHELAWYLALNRARLPAGHTKETTMAALRDALEGRGVSTAGWWEHQLRLCLLGAVVQFGWEKGLGDDAELRWWCDRAGEGLTAL
ncbi:MAG TPA: hypothetical protein VHE80_07325 [Acidimicrobiales bacterium]|nr:hypothetical protein [Acidimicrobiales bacterium]